jgi:predicted ATPase
MARVRWSCLWVTTTGRYPPLDLTPERQKQLTLEVLVDQLDGLSAEQPVLLIYEDAHWADPTTLELLGLVIERLQRLALLAVVTFGWSSPRPGPAYHTSARCL